MRSRSSRRRGTCSRAGGSQPDEEAEQSELLGALRARDRRGPDAAPAAVLVALAIDGVPIDVLAERVGSTRGALYKTLHDARRKLRAHLTERGFALEHMLEER